VSHRLPAGHGTHLVATSQQNLSSVAVAIAGVGPLDPARPLAIPLLAARLFHATAQAATSGVSSCTGWSGVRSARLGLGSGISSSTPERVSRVTLSRLKNPPSGFFITTASGSVNDTRASSAFFV
jgi:hypothetical protein